MLKILRLVLCTCIFFMEATTGEDISLFYQDSHVTPYSCSFELQSPQLYDCACVSGLWFLYDSCGEVETVTGGTRHCTKLKSLMISKAAQLIKYPHELSLVKSDGTVTSLTPEDSYGTQVNPDMLLLTGSEWTLTDKSDLRICMSVPQPESYCFYSNREGSEWVVSNLERGCDEYDYYLEPVKCVKIGRDNENICEGPSAHHIVRRQTDPAAPPPADPAAAAPAGAAPPAGGGASGNSTGFQDVMPEDEDYAALSSNKTENSTDSPISIEKGIIDYMDSNLDKYLDLPNLQMAVDGLDLSGRKSGSPKDAAAKGKNSSSNGKGQKGRSHDIDDSFQDQPKENRLNVTYQNPVYEFLHLCTKIMHKTCPSFYAKPEFINLAVATFIRMQQLEFKFPENTFKPSGFRRILNWLRKCEAKAEPFPFLNTSCNGVWDGKYNAFGENLEMTITSDYADLNRDPIVETVWKVFFNAHSYCFPFFNKTLDHHRFTTWMIPLFQNEINDLWTRGKTTNTSLNGMFGNQILIQGNLGYCAVSSRLVSNYPWDLPRPARVHADGSSSNSTGGAGAPPPPGAPAPDSSAPAAAPAPPGRRRREVDDYTLADHIGTCLDSSKPLLCKSHISSIIKY